MTDMLNWMTESRAMVLGGRRGSAGIAAPVEEALLWIQANR